MVIVFKVTKHARLGCIVLFLFFFSGKDVYAHSCFLSLFFFGGDTEDKIYLLVISIKKDSGDCTTVATQPRQLHYSNNFSKKNWGKFKNKIRVKVKCVFIYSWTRNLATK